MPGENEITNFPPPQPPRQVERRRGSLIALDGLVFGFLPSLITLFVSIFINDVLNEGTNALGALH